MIKKLALAAVLIVFFSVAFAKHTPTIVHADTLEELNKKIEEYQNQINSLQSKADTLSNQIAQYNAKIQLMALKIEQTQEQIGVLGGRIDQLQVSLEALDKAFNSRAVETYKLARIGQSSVTALTSPNVSEAVSRFYYLKKIQKADYDLLSRLKAARETYQVQKGDLEELEKTLDAQKKELDQQKAAKDSLLAATKNDEKRYQQLLSEAKAQLSAFQKFAASQGGATLLSNQTRCDAWGCYYSQRDSEWGNMLIVNSPYTLKDAGCLVTSVAMVAKHYGKNVKPSDIGSYSDAFFSTTGNMWQTWSQNGISVTRASMSVTESNIDSEINSGRPVIAGVYGSYSVPEHFIVIKGKDGGGYIMYDPFLENGGDGVKHLTDKYNFSDLRRIDRITVN